MTKLAIILLLTSILLTSAIPGGRTPIKDVKTNKEVQDLGKYSVDEYNKLQKGGGDVKFSKVIAAETQVVAGTKYYLKIQVISKSGESKVFDAEVVVKPWLHSKQLLGFKPSQGK